MRIRDRSTVYLFSISVCMGSWVVGYQLTCYSSFTQLLAQNDDFQTQQWYANGTALLNSILPLAAIFGASLYRCVIKSFGFIDTFRYLDYLTIVASLWAACSLSYQTQIFTRFLLGLIVGLNSIVIPTYLTSCLPGAMDGPAGTLNQLFITIGIFFGYLLGLPILSSVPEDMGWRLVLALPCLPVLVRLYTTRNVFPYQTVERMIETGNDYLLHRYVDHIWEDVSLSDFKVCKEMDSEDLLAEESPPCEPIGESARRRLAVVCGIILFNQLSGSGATFALGQYVFAQVQGPEAADLGWAYTKIAFLQVVVTYLAGQLLDKFTRRSFLLEGMRIILVANLLLAIIEYAAPELKTIEYLVIALHMVGFSLSFGPLSFVLATELMHDITYPTILFWVLVFASGLSGDALLVRFGASGMFLFYSIVTVVGLFYLGGSLVETKGRSRQQVYRQFRDQCLPLPMQWRQLLARHSKAAIVSITNLSNLSDRGSA